MLVDRGRTPVWKYASVQEVSEGDEVFFRSQPLLISTRSQVPDDVIEAFFEDNYRKEGPAGQSRM